MNIFTQKRIYFPQPQNPKLKRLLFSFSIISIVAFVSFKIFIAEGSLPYPNTRDLMACQTMKNAISSISAFCDSAGIPIDLAIDPNRTGLIGPEISPIATTLGILEAKRTTTNPKFASIIIKLLDAAGVAAGDTVAIGCSASFPALMIASLAAAQVMNVFPVVIISLGSSSFGASNPDFNLLNIYQVLHEKKIVSELPAAISLGGDQDVGRDFDASIRERLIQQIQFSGIPFIFEADLQKNVALRMKIYEGSSTKYRVSAFINIGGSYANIGTSELALKVKPGLNRHLLLPAAAERGVIFEMAGRKVPVIHLLYIKGLAIKYGLPWDPIPLPEIDNFKAGVMLSENLVSF